MTPPSNNPPSRSPAERLFNEHLARLERGEEADFEALCAAHPEEADELDATRLGIVDIFQR